jgi:hypothetical protein
MPVTRLDVRRLRDEVRLKLHLAGMDARDRWHALEPVLGIALRTLRAGLLDALDPERPR